MKVDWSKIPTEYQWATGDRGGITIWWDIPQWFEENQDWWNGSANWVISTNPSPVFLVKRPTEGDTHED